MRLLQCLFLILLCLFLQCCASPHYSQELERGKILFSAGKYRPAFCQLLPIAASGNARAQYAIGYMYYYGYGVARDTDSGLFWMSQSAQQNCILAVRALALIQRHEFECGPYITQPILPTQEEIQEIRQKLSDPCYEPPVRQVRPVIKPSCFEPPIKEIKAINKPTHCQHDARDEVLASLEKGIKKVVAPEKGKYAWQLIGSYHVADVKNFQKQLHLETSTHIYLTKNNGKDWYVLTYGKYVSLADAKLARDQLPEKTIELSPWVRNVETLEVV